MAGCRKEMRCNQLGDVCHVCQLREFVQQFSHGLGDICPWYISCTISSTKNFKKLLFVNVCEHLDNGYYVTGDELSGYVRSFYSIELSATCRKLGEEVLVMECNTVRPLLPVVMIDGDARGGTTWGSLQVEPSRAL